MAAGGDIRDTAYIQWLKGLGIVLVVVGHFYSRVFAWDWLDVARRLIYLFHMPLFMAIAGFLYALSRPMPVRALAAKKFRRLLVPYIFVSALVGLAKLIARRLDFALQRPVSAGDLQAFLFMPHHGFAFFLWFLYTLFVIFCLVRLLEAARVPLGGLLLAAAGLRFVPLPALFCLDLVGANLVFFVFGMVLQRGLDTGRGRRAAGTSGSVALCGAGFAGLAWMTLHRQVQGPVWATLGALAGILACWALALRLGRGGPSLLAWLGTASSTIYLLHTLSLGLMRYVWEHGIGVASWPRQAGFFASTVAISLAVPAWLHYFLGRHLPAAGQVLLGMGPRRPPSGRAAGP